MKFVRNLATLDVTNTSSETEVLNPKEMLGILELRSIGYHKIKHGFLEKNLVNILDLNQQMCLL